VFFFTSTAVVEQTAGNGYPFQYPSGTWVFKYRKVRALVLLFFRRSCAYDDAHNVHDETGSAGRVSRLVTVSTDPFTKPNCPISAEWAKCQPGNTPNGGTVLPIANLTADSEYRSPASYSSFLVGLTICLSRLVLDMFACDRQTDVQRGHTIAGLHLVAGQLIMLVMRHRLF